MIELSARNPTWTAPRGGCVSNRLWGSRRLRWDESKWTRQRVRLRARTAVQDLFQVSGRSEDACWILDARSKIGNFKRAPVDEPPLLPKLRLRAGNERDKGNARQASGKPPHGTSTNCLVGKVRHKTSCWFHKNIECSRGGSFRIASVLGAQVINGKDTNAR
jgi:hypothetical protein